MKKVKRFKYWILPFSLLLLSSCQGSPFSSEDFTSKIFPNGYWDFLIQVLAFIVLIIAVFFLGYKPVKKMLKKRDDTVSAMIEEAKQNQKVAAEAAARKDDTIAEGKAEANRIIISARKQAEEEAAAILSRAEEEVSLRKKKADEEIEAAKLASKQQIHDEIVDVALAASSKVLGREVSQQDHQELLDDFLKDIEKE